MTTSAERGMAMVEQAFSTWASDVADLRDNAFPVAVIPAACAWANAMHHQGAEQYLPIHFAANLLANERAVSALSTFMNPCPWWRFSAELQIPFDDTTEIGQDPRSITFSQHVLMEGRKKGERFMGRELSLVTALGKYACDDSVQPLRISLKPLVFCRQYSVELQEILSRFPRTNEFIKDIAKASA